MQKSQLDRWIHGEHDADFIPPKVFVIGCSDLSQYLLAVEYKDQIEPIKKNDEPLHFDSLELVKEELIRLGVEQAFLRLHNAYDEFGGGDAPLYYDEVLPLTPH